MTDRRPRRLASLGACALAVAAASAASASELSLQLSQNKRYFPGDSVVVTLKITDLDEPASGFQAFLQYDTDELTFVAASYTPLPFGEPIITHITPEDGMIDVASGLDLVAGQSPATSDAVLVVLAFTANQVGCVSSVDFRPHSPPSRITNAAAEPIGPLALNGLAPEPLPCGCPCEFDGNSNVDVFDLLAYLDLWFVNDGQAELDGTGGIDVFDLLAYLDCWFPASAGSPCG